MDETEKFVNSYNDCSTYPTNLVYDQSRLKSQKYKKEVDKHEQSLFTTDPDDAKSFIVVLIRDYGVVSPGLASIIPSSTSIALICL